MSGVFDYDSELLFNPEGRIKQLEFIKKTTELGNTTVALCNASCGVLIAYVPKRSKLAEGQQKVFEVNEKTLFTFSGITNDGLSIVRYLKAQSVFENVIKDRDLHHISCFDSLCLDAALRTIDSSKRLYGVAGILLTDHNGVRLVEFEPTGYAREVIGISIGSKSQSCRTILEDKHELIRDANEEDLIKIGLKALRNAYPDPTEKILDPNDICIYVLSSGKGFKSVDAGFFE
ncbi:Proteasome subunit alpha type-6 [Glugoides intestinalis]